MSAVIAIGLVSSSAKDRVFIDKTYDEFNLPGVADENDGCLLEEWEANNNS